MRTKTRKSDLTTSPSNQCAKEREADRSDHGHALLTKGWGTTDRHFLDGLLRQQGNSGPLEGLTFKLSVVDGVKPRDHAEALLAAQIAEVHVAVMTFARRAQSDNLTQRDIAERAFNRLVRTFATLVETLQRYRTGGDQKVTVQQVSVSDGGAGDRGQRDPGPIQHRAGEDCEFVAYYWRTGTTLRLRPGEVEKMTGNRPRNTGPMLSSLRCGAKTRSNKPCRSPAVSGKKCCRMHGGAAGSGAPRGNKNALKHGLYSH